MDRYDLQGEGHQTNRDPEGDRRVVIRSLGSLSTCTRASTEGQ